MTQKEKIAIYERLLHNIQLHREVTMNGQAVKELLDRICDWSYSHRSGNGELSESEQRSRVKTRLLAFDLPLKVKEQ